ncbi:hypothetical protein TSAR_002375 [Trichomalopsis sarcophagae]|uniref:Uncharacterized protein n=1 Tax=Trichomalopsis sarcophagae TaxID=543379 RepID=A0A232FJ75_9HYME|nr:hypothetical protein TSAR_002375 [Trichomalopsis sarcophagae]
MFLQGHKYGSAMLFVERDCSAQCQVQQLPLYMAASDVNGRERCGLQWDAAIELLSATEKRTSSFPETVLRTMPSRLRFLSLSAAYALHCVRCIPRAPALHAHTRFFSSISLTQRSQCRVLSYSSLAFRLLNETTYRVVAAGESLLRDAWKPRDQSLSSALPRKVGRWLIRWRPSRSVFFSAFPISFDRR